MKVDKLREEIFRKSVKLSFWLNSREGQMFVGIFVVFLILNSSEAHAQAKSGYNGKKYGELCKRVLETVEGNFGGLLTAAAGLGAVVASAAGGFKMAWSLLVVSIGTFTLRTYQEIWFSPCG